MLHLSFTHVFRDKAKWEAALRAMPFVQKERRKENHTSIFEVKFDVEICE